MPDGAKKSANRYYPRDEKGVPLRGEAYAAWKALRRDHPHLVPTVKKGEKRGAAVIDRKPAARPGVMPKAGR